ncbi:hypothetical protein M231_02297 [Tremella mesenterica]|uniref:CENP-C homolog n=1 Tax=Tremella mesenterica TaxID=5217 RepID=A0A4Q1BR93_TREME|nr:uncharacterized protein TREMEDRAFT_70107 [Tremella mesenterica DSM 1558]EIW66523.1 hypothetical protein TREMEDRAFT_70107 [Tremella mesenterica DSM 1558]RXK40464.1 hypothetical protein M231_02297 [Tremella mesenterica]
MATQTTPGGTRRPRLEKAYVPFNAQPKAVGTRSGAPMPTNVPRRSDGFEDPDAFFKSPASEHPFRGRKSIIDTPGTVTSVGTVRRGRMSELVPDDDDDPFAEDLLGDEDDLARATPPPFFSKHNPPSVRLPKTSRLPPASPSVRYGDIPSPQKNSPYKSPRKSITAANRARRSSSTPPPEAELGIDELESTYVSQPDDTPPPPSRRKRRISDDDEVEPEVARHQTNRSSMMNKRTVQTEESDDEDAAGRSIMYDTGHEPEFDDPPTGFNGDAPDDMDLEDEQEMEDGEEEQEQEQEPQAESSKSGRKRARSKKDQGDSRKTKMPVKRGPISRVLGQEKHAIRKRISELEDDPDNDGVSGDFIVRRSGRKHFAPLAWWRGEKFSYKRGDKLAIIKEIVKVPEEVPEPLSSRYKPSRTGRSQSVKMESADVAEPEGLGWDNQTDPIGIVKDYPSGAEAKRRIAFPQSRLSPKPSETPGGHFLYQKVFGEEQFIAAGVIYIPVGGIKPGKHSKDNAYIFYVIAGAVNVKVHRTSFVMGVGSMFRVPRGNHYSIENISPNTQVQLFFAQARKLRSTEEEDTMADGVEEVEGETVAE